ncbi:hypothetical protein KY290_025649 [Solanum tuberosum]|uniref:Uncharacterized protein n=1 Tax=Solanum tuberosum TaxID=4113 RepID=A0ABQ7UVW1_SOLTU|nr:hypothetical protein KY290_025649 [Solanum tuberosum]
MKSPLVGSALPSKSGICYDHLSDHVKPCLVCLASYPKHEDIWMSELKDLLIVQGLVEQIEMKSAEEVVNELIVSSLTKAKALPPSFSNLCNLETLVEGSCMVLSPCFWSLAKQRDVSMNICSFYDPNINEPTVLDEESRFPNLQNLEVCIGQLPDCSAEKICFPRLDIMRLQWLSLTSDTLSRIGRLPNLQELILEDTIIEEGKEWNMEDVTFQNLKSLKLDSVEFSEWQVDAEKSFPVLEKLYIATCDKLMEIPDSFGDIASLELIKVWYSPQLKGLIFNIKEYVEEMTGEDKLEVCFQGRWSRECEYEYEFINFFRT